MQLQRLKGFTAGDFCQLGQKRQILDPTVDIKDIAIEDKGKLRIEGDVSVERSILRGTIQLGFTRRYLDWLPQAEEVFNRQRNGYLWTTVHLSGTIDEPGQDLSPRIIELFQQSPGAYLQLLFRQFGRLAEENTWRRLAVSAFKFALPSANQSRTGDL